MLVVLNIQDKALVKEMLKSSAEAEPNDPSQVQQAESEKRHIDSLQVQQTEGINASLRDKDSLQSDPDSLSSAEASPLSDSSSLLICRNWLFSALLRYESRMS